MSILDQATSAVINKATTAVTSITNLVTSLGSVADLASIIDAVTGSLSTLGEIFQKVEGVTLPLPNPLFAYDSYTYSIGLGCLTDNQLTNPDTTYMAGQTIALICKSANADPTNRVNTPYGKFDFFIDNLVMTSQIGLSDGKNSNVTDVSFTIIEPYSMGLFMISCQQLAMELGHPNFRDAPFVVTIDFKGNVAGGLMSNIPNTSRKFVIRWNDVDMSVTDSGSVYKCTASPYGQIALSDSNAKFKSDVSVKGKTVQEVLQTGEKSLQVVANKRLQQQVESGLVETADEIVILFPQNTASASTTPAASNTDGATTASNISNSSLATKLGLTRSTVVGNKTLVQSNTECNAIGAAKMGFNEGRKSDAPFGKDNDIYDDPSGTFFRGNLTVDIQQGEFKFVQETDIPNAINQVLLQSSFASGTLTTGAMTPTGMRKWWRIDTQYYNLTSELNKSTGIKPKLIVYRVVPYEAHTAALMPPNLKAPGFANLKKEVVKEYNYIYTGKNVDIITFEIRFNSSFTSIMAANNPARTQDSVQAASSGQSADVLTKLNPLGEGSLPSTIPGSIPSTVQYVGTSTGTERQGGGGAENAGTRAARLFMDAITIGHDMIDLSMTIIGDPYFIVQSGLSNYTSESTQYKNLNKDGTVNYQNGEVDISVNFRNPVDINQATGLYDFGDHAKSAPVIQFSGLYKIQTVTNTFSGALFTQTLIGNRRNHQEQPVEATPDQVMNTTSVEIDPLDPDGYGDA